MTTAAVLIPLSLQADARDPFLTTRSSWDQPYDDHWALKRVGFLPPGEGVSAWDVETGEGKPVIVAVIDSGLDYFHPDLAPENVWRNPAEEPNGLDDDGNGYLDDLMGWNFYDGDNNPWDNAGHGTHVAGIIAATTGNGEGIAGIHRGVKIMPLKVLNFLGRGRSSGIAEAIFYAVRHGARVINLSLGGEHLSETERIAIDYAHERGAVVVVAAGNESGDISGFGPAGLERALTVVATDPDDRRFGVSNWGQGVSLAAPGADVLSLRARRTDFVLLSGAEGYEPATAFVGEGARYYRASGTSFAAPFVSGTAALLFSKDPSLTNEQVERMLLMSADDVEVPGWDQYTGFGRLNALEALRADPDWFLVAKVSGVEPAVVDGRRVIRLRGTAQGSHFRYYVVELGRGEEPDDWRSIGSRIEEPVEDGELTLIPLGEITARGRWTVRVIVHDEGGQERQAWGSLDIQ